MFNNDKAALAIIRGGILHQVKSDYTINSRISLAVTLASILTIDPI